MQGWQIALVVLVAVFVGALLPLVVQLYGTLHTLRVVVEKSAKDIEAAVVSIHRTADRVDRLGASLEQDGKLSEIIDGAQAAAQVMNQMRSTMAKLLTQRIKVMSTAAQPNLMTSGIWEIWLEITCRCIDIAMNGSPM